MAPRRLNRRALLRLSGGALLTATACRPRPVALPTVAPPPPSPTPAARLVVGAVLDMRDDRQTGGLECWRGALLGVETVNAGGGVPLPNGTRMDLELVAYTTEPRGDSVAAALERLTLVDGALAVVVDGGDAVVDAARHQAGHLGLPTILLDERGVGATDPARWTYALGTSDVDAMAVLVPFLAAHEIRDIGWIAPRTATADAARSALIGEAARTPLRVVAEERYAAGGEPAPEALTRLAFAGAQAIIGWPGDVDEAAGLARTAAERARGVTLYLGPVAAAPASLSRAGGAASGARVIGTRLAVPDYLWDSDPLTAPTRQFLAAFRQRFGATPSVAAAAAWDAVRIIAAAVARSGADRAGLRDAIGRIEAFSGASGPIDLSAARPNGLDGRAFVIARAERGAWVLPP